MQWKKNMCEYLQQNVRAVQNQEQTLEVRLPEGQPDVGNILCAWGQPEIRSKQWKNDGMVVSGGVNAKVLYAPEDGSEPRTLEGWLPFQAKWNFPESKREGTMQTWCVLRSIDARALSSRKIMVRCSVGILGQALEPSETMMFIPDTPMQDIQILEKTYPVDVPVEAGEKLISMDEEIPLPSPDTKLIAWDIVPVTTEQNVVGGRVVIKGNARLHLVYMAEDGQLHSVYHDLPFAQFSPLDKDYDKEATVSTMLEVSSLETEVEEAHIRVKTGLIAQYIVYDRKLLTLAEDAYSPFYSVSPVMQDLQLPIMLDQRRQNVDMQVEAKINMTKVADATVWPDHPVVYRENGQAVLEMPGMLQILGYDEDGNLISSTENWTERIEIPAAAACNITTAVCMNAAPVASPVGENVHLSCSFQLDIGASTVQQIPMIRDLEVGEQLQPDPDRPSLILRRVNEESLWTLAKDCGSTMEAIRKANQLSGEPIPGQMLLIPVC